MHSIFEKTWRWFGLDDTISLAEIKQMDIEGIVTSLHHIPNGEVWSVDEIQKVKQLIESHNMRWSVVESLPVSEIIKTGGIDRDHLIENYKQSLMNLGKCGINRVCYNFMPVLDWARTNIHHKLNNGGETMIFEYPVFAAFDIFILKRHNAQNDYPKDIVLQAKQIFSSLSSDEQESLAYNIIVLTQSFIDGAVEKNAENYKELFLSYITDYDNIDEMQLRQNLKYFLSQIMPVADANNIKMCIHPDDPPFPILGLPRIVSTMEDLEWIVDQYPSINNGITFCAGSLSVLPKNNLQEIVKTLGNRIHFAHLRSTQRLDRKSFIEADHLEGSVDMYALLRSLIIEQRNRKDLGCSDFRIPVRADHGIKILDDFNRKSNPGYPLIGRLKGLTVIESMATAIEKNLSLGD